MSDTVVRFIIHLRFNGGDYFFHDVTILEGIVPFMWTQDIAKAYLMTSQEEANRVLDEFKDRHPERDLHVRRFRFPNPTEDDYGPVY